MRLHVAHVLAACSLWLAATTLVAQTGPAESPSSRPGAPVRPGEVGPGPTPSQPGAVAPAQPAETPPESVPSKARQYYPPRPQLPQPLPQLDSLLNEIEAEAEEMLPLFGQRLFWQAVIDRALGAEATAAPRIVASPPPSYQVLPGDKVAIVFWNALVAPQVVETEIREDGTIGFDPIGVVQVSGLTVDEFKSLLTRLIRLRGPRNAEVRITFTGLHDVRVRVTGAVRRMSGAVVLNGYATLFDALAAAGGPSAYASLRTIRLYRGDAVQEIDLYAFLLRGDPTLNPALRDGDSIHVPTAKRLVSVQGQVQQPARYELLEEQGLAAVIDMAGGLTGRAARIQVERTQDYQRQILTDLSVPEVVENRGEPIELRHGDTVRVLALGEIVERVSVMGAVGLAGDYGWRPGMTLGEAIALAQGLLPSGHVAVGSIRRSRPDGQVESINFEVAELRAGGAAAAIPLQAGDVIDIPRVEERAPLTVVVSGAVNQPGTYTMTVAQTVSDLIRAALGLAPGHAMKARLLSTATGQPVETSIDLTAMERGGQPVPNPTLANGDQLIVPLLENVGGAATVRVEGFVRQEGTYPLTAGMRVADLIDRAGGLLPRAARRAKLTRVLPGTAESAVQYLDLERALVGDEAENVELQAEDLLEIKSAELLLAPTEPTVTISGPVERPGLYSRHRGMTVSALIAEAGGLRLEADRETAFVIRPRENGRTQHFTINPARAVAGDPDHDLVLADGDSLEIQRAEPLTAGHRQIRVSGAVYNPGSYPFADGMTVGDLVARARLLPEAYLPRAELFRRLPTGGTRLVPLDLSLRPLTYPLEDGDELRVYTHEEAVYREPTIEIWGDVQRPGRLERSEGMTVRDVIEMAGGPTRNVDFMVCEVSRGRGAEAVILRPDLKLLLAGDETQNFPLEDGDAVYLRTFGEYHYRSRQVLVQGQVRLPGHFPLTGDDDSLRRLIAERAGGVSEGAFVEGAILLRRVDQVVAPEHARYASDIFRNLTMQRERDDYSLFMSRSSAEALQGLQGYSRYVPTDAVRSPLEQEVASDEDLTGPAADLARAHAELYAAGSDQPPGRRQPPPLPNSLQQYVRLAIDLRGILDGRTADVQLKPGDIVVIPERPDTVLVQGWVHSSLPLPFVEGRRVRDYLAAAGGIDEHGDANHLLVVRANGIVQAARRDTIVQRGDLILVPPARLKIPPPEMNRLQEFQALASILGGISTTVLAISRAF